MSDTFEPGDPVGRAILLLREPVPIAPGLVARAEQRRRQRIKRRVAGGVSLALLVLTLGLVTRHAASSTAITFSIAAPGGRSVALVGDFTDWRSDRVLLERASSGLWRATVKLRPGQYRFAYLIDQVQWRADSAAASAPDDFGRPTSVLTVVSN